MLKATVMLLAAATSVLVHSAASAANEFAWGAIIRGLQLIVVVDTRTSPRNLVVDSASFNATYFAANNASLGTRHVALPARQIVPGQLLRFGYDAPPSAARVELSTILADWRADGGKADGQELAPSAAIDPTLFAAPVVVPPPPALGQRCSEYGRLASEQHTRNLAMSCGYSGNRWQSSAAFHEQWCSGAKSSEADAETLERDTLLRRCARLRIVRKIGG